MATRRGMMQLGLYASSPQLSRVNSRNRGPGDLSVTAARVHSTVDGWAITRGTVGGSSAAVPRLPLKIMRQVDALPKPIG